MDPETIDGTTVKLVKKGTTTPVAATLSRPAPDKVVLDPNKSLARGDTYTATIAGAGDLEPARPGPGHPGRAAQDLDLQGQEVA
jgi:hypothetical protein